MTRGAALPATASAATAAGDEQGVVFDCEGSRLVGVLHGAARPARLGVVVVVGGPQYRVGSHRQFLLLARALAAAGVPVLRFDYRGMGDAEGEWRGFLHVEQDIRAAVDTLAANAAGVEGVVLWGLCDGATAAALYAGTDPRVRGLVLLNPWVHSEAGQARTFLRHYYLQRILSPDFWRKLLSGRVALLDSARGFLRDLLSATGKGERVPAPADAGETPPAAGAAGSAPGPDLVAALARGLSAVRVPLLLVCSGQDFTAREFEAAAKEHRGLSRAVTRRGVTRVSLPDADHTFSRAAWRDEVAVRTAEWLRSLA